MTVYTSIQKDYKNTTQFVDTTKQRGEIIPALNLGCPSVG